MKTLALENRHTVPTVAGSEQSTARKFQRQPIAIRAKVAPKATDKGPSFREILERKLGVPLAQRQDIAPGAEEQRTTQFLAGYWA
ncbi:MAG: hypothetical protein N2Z22_05935 [Turneriella sp.]|nr:hypothetical protein [Leptospiraceae bacterium]MCX7632853.1 hypothetical protein [Turneriella sp.]